VFWQVPPAALAPTHLTLPMLSRPFALAVVGNEAVFGSDGSRFSLFTVSVQCSDVKWTLKRRYSDFRNLHIKLRHAFPSVKVSLTWCPEARVLPSRGRAARVCRCRCRVHGLGIAFICRSCTCVANLRRCQLLAWSVAACRRG
jgi:hypothetical protein